MIEPAVRLRPMSLSDILDEAFRLYREHFVLFWSVALVLSIPSLVFDFAGLGGGTLATLQTYAKAASSGSRSGFFIPPTQQPSNGGLVAVGYLVTVVFLPLSGGAMIKAATAVALGTTTTVSDVFRFTLGRYWMIWGMLLLVGLTYLSMIFLLTIPVVIYFVTRWSLRYQVLFLEDAGVTDSFHRSSTLVRGSWWRVFGILFLVGILVALLGSVVGLVAGFLGAVAPADYRRLVSALLGTLATSVVLPLPALVSTLLYLDLRVRKEQLDLQVMAGQSGAPPPLPWEGPGSAPPHS
ncbi:MAG: hypothetical protein ACYDGR_05940 [Candidatus Dormibacteria bacterium]